MTFLLAVLPYLRRSDTDPGEMVFALFFGLVFAWITQQYVNRFKRGADAHDHVVETSRDVAIPDHCVGCCSAHAPHPLKIRTMFIGVPPLRVMTDPTIRKNYRFHFCLPCSRPVRRRHKLGKAAIVTGIALYVHMVLFLFLMAWDPFGDAYEAIVAMVGLEKLSFFVIIFLDMICGALIMYTGMWMRMYSPYVRIVDTGEPKIFFRFRSQVFRNHFAELNGEA